MDKTSYEQELELRILELETEMALLKEKSFVMHEGATVSVPMEMKPLFDVAQKTVKGYFSQLAADPTQASIEIAGQRYILLRASSLSIDFFNTIQKLYPDKTGDEAFKLSSTFLFDIAHVIGMEDSKAFHPKTGITEPIAKLSAGPVHFAYAGWAFVNIDPTSQPSPDNNFILKYTHPYSFEADSWVKANKKSSAPVCIMSSGYSSGWAEDSFGFPLTAVEITCRACGDEECSFIMAPPHMIEQHLKEHHHKHQQHKENYTVPTFFERKKVEEQMQKARKKAEESDRAKSDFLANMSHEMRTPLNAIRGYINLMQKDTVSTEHLEYLNVVNQSSEHLLNIINDILDLSKIEAGQLMIIKQNCDLKRMLEDSFATASRLLEIYNKKIELSYNFDANIASNITTDNTRLKQILYNLLSNALKFTHKGFVEFGVKLTKNEELLFYVHDSGLGVSEDKQQSIFNMFDQVDNSSTREFGGTGLGLTITQKLVELLGGKIWLESSLNKGSSFYFTLPYLPAQTSDNLKDNSLKDLAQSTLKKMVLIVEDNLISQKLTALVLKKANFETFICNNGQEAVDFYMSNQRQEISLILMDVQMPVLDGLSATKIIRQYEQTEGISPIPIIALTAQAMQGDMDKCLEAGCNSYLTKPISVDSFIDSILNTLS